ncbi:YqeB family protein [Amycolatopsis nigrescens]|uniref:YqeB family protein n=1 Tax=Amycolatopsis nigrescens TaxID=381445 RepID=UPI00058C476A|nr:hypothetical protein [Amycolatopsis nigrescens]
MVGESSERQVTGDATIVADPVWLRPATWLVCPFLGGAAGWGLKLAAGWLLSLSWVPFKGPLELIESIPEPLGMLGAIAIGVAAGLVLAYLVVADLLTVRIGHAEVALERGGKVQRVPRPEISAVFLTGKNLTLLDESGSELASASTDLSGKRLREAFRGQGLPWQDGGDPFADDYRLWVEDMPDLPAGANALLRARTRALRKHESEEASVIRAELVKLGVLVRDEKKHQYWRLSGQR